jgi:hypothetical protein
MYRSSTKLRGGLQILLAKESRFRDRSVLHASILLTIARICASKKARLIHRAPSGGVKRRARDPTLPRLCALSSKFGFIFWEQLA